MMFSVDILGGCIDSLYFNYDNLVQILIMNLVIIIYGCTDSAFILNMDSNANT